MQILIEKLTCKHVHCPWIFVYSKYINGYFKILVLGHKRPFLVWSQTSGSQTSWSQKGGHKRPGHKRPGHKRPGHKRPGHKRPGHKRPPTENKCPEEVKPIWG